MLLKDGSEVARFNERDAQSTVEWLVADRSRCRVVSERWFVGKPQNQMLRRKQSFVEQQSVESVNPWACRVRSLHSVAIQTYRQAETMSY